MHKIGLWCFQACLAMADFSTSPLVHAIQYSLIVPPMYTLPHSMHGILSTTTIGVHANSEFILHSYKNRPQHPTRPEDNPSVVLPADPPDVLTYATDVQNPDQGLFVLGASFIVSFSSVYLLR